MMLFASLACLPPSYATTDAPLGVVLQANLAHVNDSAVSAGATVYSGEELSTDDGGSLDLRIVNSRFGLGANSRAYFYAGARGSIAELTSGTLTFRKDAGSEGLEVVASDVRIVPKGEGAVTGQVSITAPCAITVTSFAGETEVTTGKDTRTVGEQESYSVTPELSVLAGRTSISPDDPDYHRSHSHKTCALSSDSQKSGRFRKIGLAAGIGGAVLLLGSKFLTASKPSVESPTNP